MSIDEKLVWLVVVVLEWKETHELGIVALNQVTFDSIGLHIVGGLFLMGMQFN